MKPKIYTFILLLFYAFLLSTINSYGQLWVDVGNDTTYCADPSTTFIPMGLKVNFQNGISPYTYAWECKIIPYGILKPRTASDVLNDSTLLSPSLINGVSNWGGDHIKFTLHVTDHTGATGKDSLNVSFSSCLWTLGYHVVELAKGDSIWLDAGKPSGSVAAYYWEPELGLSNPRSSATWCKPTTSMSYNIVRVDTFGCTCSNQAYEIRIIPTDSENKLSNDESLLHPFQKGSKVYFANAKNQEALISLFSLDGKLVYQCTTSNDYFEALPVLSKKGTYIVKILLKGDLGVCRYLMY